MLPSTRDVPASSTNNTEGNSEAEIRLGHDQQAKIIGGFGRWQFIICIVTGTQLSGPSQDLSRPSQHIFRFTDKNCIIH